MKIKKAKKPDFYDESEEQNAKDQAELYDSDVRAETWIDEGIAKWEE